MKEKLEEEYLRRVKKLLESKLYSKNVIDRIDMWAVGVIPCSAGIINWTIQNFKRIDT